MTKKQVLVGKIELLIKEIDNTELLVDREKYLYLETLRLRLNDILIKLRNDEFPESEGRIIGTIRCISEYDSLANIKSLYDAAVAVDLFYSRECIKW